MTRFVLICLGGAIGTGARYAVALWTAHRLGAAFPYGTLLVNILGSTLLGMVMQLSLTTDLIGADVRLIVATGILGGFTTYSTFNYETLILLREGAWLLAMTNVGITLIGCLAGAALGMAIARLIAA